MPSRVNVAALFALLNCRRSPGTLVAWPFNSSRENRGEAGIRGRGRKEKGDDGGVGCVVPSSSLSDMMKGKKNPTIETKSRCKYDRLSV